MVKHLLLFSLLAIPFVPSMGQTIKKADNVAMFNISSNGKYACSSNEGTVVIWNTEEDNALTTFNDDYYYGDAISDDGTVAGSIGVTGQEKPVIISGDKITNLPMPSDITWSYGSGRGISPDGTMVCGHLTRGDVNIMDNVTFTLPYVWEINGDQITCTALPYPEKDFTGRYPHGYHPLFVSTDKNRILGRQIDYSGLAGAIVVWQRTAPGEPWSYTLLGEDLIYKDGPAFPAFPEEPEAIDYTQYMTEDEIAAYNEAFQEWTNNGHVGESPKREDFITDETRKAQYLEALTAYNAAVDEYSKAIDAFNEVYYQRMTGSSLDLYSMSGSFNGRYVGCTLQTVDMSDYFPTTITYPLYYDLNDNNKCYKLEKDQYKNTGMAGHITDAGDLVISNPAMASIYDPRNSYVVPAGKDQPEMFYTYLSDKTGGKVNRQTFVDAGMAYSWTDYSTGEPTEVTDSVLVGSALLSADGMNAMGFSTNPSTFTFSSWAINGGSTTGIHSAAVKGTEKVLRTNVIEDGTIEYVADAASAMIYDMSGAVVFSGRVQNGSIAAPTKSGMYLLRTKLNDGSLTTDKIIVK